jgi:hypothetical protein
MKRGRKYMIKTTDALSIVKRVKARITDPSKWCTNEWALNAIGEPVQPEELDACKWCLLGAVRKERITDGPGYFTSELFNILSQYLPRGEGPLDHFNDTKGYYAVHSLLDRAIQDLERKVIAEG